MAKAVLKKNYQKELDSIVQTIERNHETPTLLLHSCCAPCSSYVLEYLSQYFKITVYYYNPNIYPPEEYIDRVGEQERLINEMSFSENVKLLKEAYHPELFYDTIKGREKDPEGGERCFLCYELRLERTAKVALKGGYDYFTTTLSISPLKNADKLNEIGQRLGEKYGVHYLVSDFKKKDGYKRSLELSAQYHLYRQNYCGCVYSFSEASLRRPRLEIV